MINYSILPEEKLIYCNLAGNLNLLDFNAYVQRVMLDQDFNPELNAIIKIRVGTTVSYTKEADKIREFISLYLQQRKGIAWAFVVPDKTTLGILHLMFDEIDSSPICVEYFYDETEARMWLNELMTYKLKMHKLKNS